MTSQPPIYRHQIISDGITLVKPRHTQVGGTHYKDMPIQPCEFIMKNGLGWAEGTAIQYIARWKQKGGVQDLKKAIHTLELLIESEG